MSRSDALTSPTRPPWWETIAAVYGWRRIGRRARRGLAVILVALLLWGVVIPQLVQARQALQSIHSLSPELLVAGACLELGSLAAYGRLTWCALDPVSRPSYWTVLRIDVVGVGVSNSFPGGGATSLATRFRLLSRAGASPGTVAGSLAIEVLSSNLLLGGVFAAGLLASLAVLPPNPYYRLAGVVVVLIFGTAAFALAFAVSHRERAARVMQGAVGRLPEVIRDRAATFAATAIENVAAFVADRRRVTRAIVWGATNWLVDAAALWVFLAAFGYHPPVGELLVAYGVAQILAVVPITPGGVGIVEGVLVPTLISFGAPPTAAILGVTAWRLVEYWMPMPLGALSAISLATRRRPRRRDDEENRSRLRVVRSW